MRLLNVGGERLADELRLLYAFGRQRRVRIPRRLVGVVCTLGVPHERHNELRARPCLPVSRDPARNRRAAVLLLHFKKALQPLDFFSGKEALLEKT